MTKGYIFGADGCAHKSIRTKATPPWNHRIIITAIHMDSRISNSCGRNVFRTVASAVQFHACPWLGCQQHLQLGKCRKHPSVDLEPERLVHVSMPNSLNHGDQHKTLAPDLQVKHLQCFALRIQTTSEQCPSIVGKTHAEDQDRSTLVSQSKNPEDY